MEDSKSPEIELQSSPVERQEEHEGAAETEYIEKKIDVDTSSNVSAREDDETRADTVIRLERDNSPPRQRFSPDQVDSNMPSDSKGPLLCIGLVLASIAALLIVILVPLSFADLEYYEVSYMRMNFFLPHLLQLRLGIIFFPLLLRYMYSYLFIHIS